KIPGTLPETLSGLGDRQYIKIGTFDKKEKAYSKGRDELLATIAMKHGGGIKDWRFWAYCFGVPFPISLMVIGLYVYGSSVQALNSQSHESANKLPSLTQRATYQILPCSPADFALVVQRADDRELESYVGQFVVWDVTLRRDYHKDSKPIAHLEP